MTEALNKSAKKKKVEEHKKALNTTSTIQGKLQAS